MAKSKWNGDRFNRKLNHVINHKVKKLANNVKGNARNIAPVDTGALRDSIKVSKKKTRRGLNRYMVGSSLPYALYVEYGTATSAPHPFLRVGLRKSRGRW